MHDRLSGTLADDVSLVSSVAADTREERVSDWRSFQKGGKKKKAKTNVLG